MLSEFGELHFNGSYAYNLMLGPDIDLYIVNKNPTKQKAVELINALIDQAWFNSVTLADWHNFRYKNFDWLPKAYYIALKTSVGNIRWKVDVWFLNPEQAKSQNPGWIKEKMTAEKKRVILELKKDRKDGKHKISSYDIYDAVLNNDVNSLSGLVKSNIR